ncbi:hypothetical protein COL10_03470 [Bacillus cereus]|uniref:hypothetical protein n=1 Tax=Bacillus cereus TaxID=1396 RepID=UPI000BECFAC6|nr:hypothetical protein [Bacillus cereus]PEF92566.1 hypothetical protein CON46_11370 [Bacillus cereus]PFD76447.1 hypothetical protein CN301_05360 [Bacillus cereus]PFV13689.1 hypothetical protein COL10_03470 [Bacillus cereus]PGV45701.1 hypothetical protein COD74_11005 [Bacillus cereus]
MGKQVSNKVEGMYVFNGFKFAEYIDVDFFREQLKEKLELDFRNESLGDIYSKVVLQYPNKKKEVDEIFFECILYNDLKHVFVHRFDGNIDKDKFKERVKKIIDNINKKETIPQALHNDMDENGFYLMDRLNIMSLTTKFIAGVDYEIEGKEIIRARLLFAEVVPTGEKSEYFIAGVDIDFKNNIYLVMIKSKQDIESMETEQENKNLDRTVSRLYNRTKEMLISKLLFTTHTMNEKADRGAMYEFCKYLDDKLLKEIREVVETKTKGTINSSVVEFIDELFSSGKKPSSLDKSELERNIQSLLTGLFIKTNYKPKELIRKAKKLELLGYATKIKFTSNKANRGATQSTNSKHPVSATEMFHSLYISFKDALSLEQWVIAWFTDYTFTTEKDIDVIQTAIYSRSTNFEIVFRPKRALEKEIIYHVVRTLNEYRTKQL